MSNGEINNLSDAIIQFGNWIDIITMDSEHNKTLEEYQSQCFKEMVNEIAAADYPFIASLFVRLHQKGKFANLDILLANYRKG